MHAVIGSVHYQGSHSLATMVNAKIVVLPGDGIGPEVGKPTRASPYLPPWAPPRAQCRSLCLQQFLRE